MMTARCLCKNETIHENVEYDIWGHLSHYHVR